MLGGIDDLPTVELRPAYVWDCSDCGREHFHNGLIAEMSEEEEQELRDEHEVSSWDTGIWMSIPETVECKWCGSKFRVIHYSEKEGETNGYPT